MRDTTLRTIGATVVLFGIAVAAILQVGPGGDPSAIALTAEDGVPSTTVKQVEDSQPTPPTQTLTPFLYSVGVLASASTDNYWAFYGEQPSVWNSYILGPTKAALYTIDPVDGTLVGELALGQPAPVVDAGGWRVEVPLRDDLAWSDGTPITARDVEFTFETVRSLGLGGSWAEAFPSVIESVAAKSDSELSIRFRERPTLSAWPYGAGLAPVMSQEFWTSRVDGLEADGLYALPGLGDPGGGPLTLVSFDEERMTSHANPGYVLATPPDVVEYTVVASEEDAMKALTAGHIDYFLSPKGLTGETVKRHSGTRDLAIHTSPANGVRYLGFNMDRAPMSDPAFRSALGMLLNRSEVTERLVPGATVANSYVSRDNVAWFDASREQFNSSLYGGSIADRLDRALGGLRLAGYTWAVEPSLDANGIIEPGSGLKIGGLELSPLTILTPGDTYDPARPLYAAQIADTLALLGFEVRPVETDFDTVVDLTFTPGDDGLLHYDMYLLGWSLGNPALPGYYHPLFAGDGSMNNTGYESEEFDESLRDYESAMTHAQATEALWDMENTLAVDLPYLLLYTAEITEVFRSDRVQYQYLGTLGGLQGLLGGVYHVKPAR